MILRSSVVVPFPTAHAARAAIARAISVVTASLISLVRTSMRLDQIFYPYALYRLATPECAGYARRGTRDPSQICT
eukprot:scaffold29519_cov54-Phaeocystis_antarctica.AAC.2